MEKIADADLWKTRAMGAELELKKAEVQRMVENFEKHLNELWSRHGLTVGVDEIDASDGTIKRAKKEGQAE